MNSDKVQPDPRPHCGPCALSRKLGCIVPCMDFHGCSSLAICAFLGVLSDL